MGEVTHAVNVDMDDMERKAPIPTLSHSCHDRRLCLFRPILAILLQNYAFLCTFYRSKECGGGPKLTNIRNALSQGDGRDGGLGLLQH